MPPIETPWTTSYPTSQDTPGTEQPDLIDDSIPGAYDGTRGRVSHQHSIRDKLQAVAVAVGDSSDLPAGCLKDRVTDLESAPPSHASTHQNGGSDEVATATPGANAIPKADGTGALAAGWVPDGADATAIHDNIDGEINAVAVKGTPVAADVILIEDSAATFAKKKATIGSLPGGGFNSYEEEFTAVAGTQTFTLSATAAVNANMLSGRTILGVFRNGVRSRYQATATLANEWDLPAGNQVRVVGQSGGEIFTVVFGV